MVDKNKQSPFESEEMNNWLKNYFLDQYTSYLDESLFRIDLYESDHSFIVEAHLPGMKRENIKVTTKKNTLTITITESDSNTGQAYMKTRSITFPFPINKNKIEAKFTRGVLEIKIYTD